MTFIVSMLVEDALRIALSRRLPHAKETIFSDKGLLWTFSSRVEMAQAMGIISENARQDLHIIRELRNAAAHAMFELSFEAEEVKNICAHIQAQRKNTLAHMSDPVSKITESESGTRFLLAGLYYFIAIGERTATQPITCNSFVWP